MELVTLDLCDGWKSMKAREGLENLVQALARVGVSPNYPFLSVIVIAQGDGAEKGNRQKIINALGRAVKLASENKIGFVRFAVDNMQHLPDDLQMFRLNAQSE